MLLAACTSEPTPTVAPSAPILPSLTATITVAPTDTPAPTDTVRPQPRVVADSTTLYAGPGNVGYKTLAQLVKGTQITPVAIYGDFVKVQTIGVSPQEGFAIKSALENLPSNLPSLSQNQVPWMEIVDAISLPEWSVLYTSTQNGRLILDNRQNKNWVTVIDDISPVILKGPFAIETQFTGQGEGYGIILIGRLRTGVGAWWDGIRYLHVIINKGRLSLDFYDGTSANLKGFTRLPESLKPQKITLQFNEDGSTVTISDPLGNPIANSPIHLSPPLFPDGILYFGMNAGPSSVLEVSRFSLLVPPTGKIPSVVPVSISGSGYIPQSPTLRDLASKRDISIGNLTPSGSSLLRAKITSIEFDQVTIPTLHMVMTMPTRNTYNFDWLDFFIKFAERYNMQVRGFHLVWGDPQWLPEWLLKGNFSRNELIKILHDYVVTVVGRYKGKIHSWSTVNEFVNRQFSGPTRDFWYANIGPDYVEMVFRWAKEADPNAILILNEDHIHDRRGYCKDQADRAYDWVRQLKQKGVPIDAVGMQMHLLKPNYCIKGSPPNKDDVIATMRRFAELGVDIYVTEFDVNLTDVPGTQAEKWTFQAGVYRDMLQACLESNVCRGFSIYGLSDNEGWYGPGEGNLRLPTAEALLFNKDLKPKPAYFALRDVLMGNNR